MSRGWGRGWQVGILKEIYRQGQTEKLAQKILRREHEQGGHEGDPHPSCPVCHPEVELL